MILLIYIWLVRITLLYSIPQDKCDRIKVGAFWYDRETIWADVGRPYSLIIHKSTNMVFFSYTLPETYSDLDFQLGYIQIDSREFDAIAGIKGGCAIAIDQDNDQVFLGGSEGIYKYNMMTKIADMYREKDKNIWSLFFNRNLFYISYPEQKLYIEIDGKFSLVKEFSDFEVDNFFVASNNDIFFANKSGLYRYDNVKMRVVVVNDLITVRQIAEDNEGNVYISTNAGVFVNTPYFGVKKIMDIRNIYGITFDRHNNMLFSDDYGIVLLTPSKHGCAVPELPHW